MALVTTTGITDIAIPSLANATFFNSAEEKVTDELLPIVAFEKVPTLPARLYITAVAFVYKPYSKWLAGCA